MMDIKYFLVNHGLILFLIGFILAVLYLAMKGVRNIRRSCSSSLAHAPSTGAERRTHHRFEVGWPVTMETGQNSTPGEIKDISIGGAFIQCQQPLPLNETFRLTICPPNRLPIVATAQVCWSNSNVPKDKVVRRGMGVRFLEISEEDRMFVKTQG